MGIIAALTGGRAAQLVNSQLDAATAISAPQLPTAITSPWSPESSLAPWVYEDILGKTGPITRAEAMRVPAVAAARSIIISEIVNHPLVALKDGQPVAKTPTWLYRTNLSSPMQRLAHTLDDLMFHGDALWATDRSEETGSILHAAYTPRSLWRIAEDGIGIEVKTGEPDQWRAARDGEVLYIPSLFDGLLNVASDTIRGALDLERSWKTQARTPLPGMVLQEREDNGMTPDEMKSWVKQIAANRRDPDGAVMGLPYKIEASFAPSAASDLLIEGRNAVKLDIANYLNINPSMIGAALPKASLNYETSDGERNEFVGRLDYWTAPIEDRLSLDDCVPAGTYVRFDMNETSNPAARSTGPTVED